MNDTYITIEMWEKLLERLALRFTKIDEELKELNETTKEYKRAIRRFMDMNEMLSKMTEVEMLGELRRILEQNDKDG